MSSRTCEYCGRPLEPVHFTDKLQTDCAILYADNLWALDGLATLTKGWACRHACGDPVAVEDTFDSHIEWNEANKDASERLICRPWRGTEDSAPQDHEHRFTPTAVHIQHEKDGPWEKVDPTGEAIIQAEMRHAQRKGDDPPSE